MKDINEKVFAATPTVGLEILAVQVLTEGVTSTRQRPRKKLLPVTKLVPHPKPTPGGLHEKTGRIIPFLVLCFLTINPAPSPHHICKANGALVSQEPLCLPAPLPFHSDRKLKGPTEPTLTGGGAVARPLFFFLLLLLREPAGFQHSGQRRDGGFCAHPTRGAPRPAKRRAGGAHASAPASAPLPGSPLYRLLLAAGSSGLGQPAAPPAGGCAPIEKREGGAEEALQHRLLRPSGTAWLLVSVPAAEPRPEGGCLLWDGKVRSAPGNSRCLRLGRYEKKHRSLIFLVREQE